MDDVEGAQTFAVQGSAYDSFMGRYSNTLAGMFCDAAGVASGQVAVDVGCGPGALTHELVQRLGVDAVSACDPSPSFRVACQARFPAIVVRPGQAEELPFETAVADHVMAQLVMHFVTDPTLAAREMARVTRPGGTVSACVWDFAEGMEMLRAFWDAALGLDPEAPDEARTLRFGGPGEIAGLFAEAGLERIEESTLRVSAHYASFDELWAGFLGGVGPAGAYCVALDPHADRERLRLALHERLGSPSGAFTLGAVARCAVGRVGG